MTDNTFELFCRVRDHLLQQRCKSVDPDGASAYRGVDGRKCAIGCLINDAQYHSDLEDNVCYAPRVQRALEASLARQLSHREMLMLDRLQRVHDCMSVSTWARNLAALEQSYFSGSP